MTASDVLRIGNGSGFYGDRLTAMREMLEGGPLDVLTGDYLAELTMLVLWRGAQRTPGTGYARTFLRQAREILRPSLDRGVRLVVNAGGLAPLALVDALRELARELDLDPAIAAVTGDDLRPRLAELRAAGWRGTNLSTGDTLDEDTPALTANAYLGGRAIAAALEGGADVVVTGRVTDASLVVGPGMWRFGWDAGRPGDLDALAGAVVAGHVLECGAQATGGNYAFFTELGDLTHIGFPVAELAADGSCTITKHPDTQGAVTVGTVTAQLLYEIDQPRYLGPDVVARFDTIALTQEGPDRVAISGVRGEPPPPELKVAVTTLGGFRNRVTYVLTGLDIEAKADLVQRQLTAAIDLAALDEVHWQLTRSDQLDAPSNAEAVATLTLTVHHHDAEAIGRRAFADACVAIGLASYPGCTLTAPPSDAEPFGRYWPTLVPAREVDEVVHLPDGTTRTLATSAAAVGVPLAGRAPIAVSTGALDVVDGPTARRPLGTLVGARSGDKGGDANVGLWVRDPAHLPWLRATVGTAAAVRRLLPEAADLDIEVIPLPNLLAVNVVVRRLLGDGVASAVRPDPQAKGLGEYLRSRVVDVPVAFLDDRRATG